MIREDKIYQVVSRYLVTCHKNVIFHFDLGSGARLTIGQAKKHRSINQNRGFPDLFLAAPRGGYSGFFIEFKRECPFKKDGTLKADPHLKEQAAVLEALQDEGYLAFFCWLPVDNFYNLIDWYLKGAEGNPPKLVLPANNALLKSILT